MSTKTVWITGASSGMGHAIVEKFVQEGANVVAVARRKERLEELAAAGADLALSGHTHNGQMFPGNLLIRLAWKNPAGVLQVGNMTSCVTQGAGVWGPAMRVGTDSEVMLLHVRFAP